MNTTKSIFVDHTEVLFPKTNEQISIYATELTVVDDLLVMGYKKAGTVDLAQRQSWLESSIHTLEEQQKGKRK